MKIKKNIICIVFIIIVIFSGNIKIYGATNSEYGGNTGSIDITESTIKDNVVLDYIGSFIFAIGNIFQDLTSWIMGAVTGESSFPWADLVVFNTIPMLDVNFFHPDANSLLSLENPIGMGEVVRNVYFTALSIGIGFLGIIVGVMAIRMAITTIASEKARYKESIITWLTAIVLLFGLHYMISFLFYLNEELVITASKILGTAITESGEDISAIINQDLDQTKKTVVDNFIEENGGEMSDSDKSIIENNVDITYLLLNNPTFREALNMVSGSDTTGILEHLGRFGSIILEGITVGNYDSPEEQQLAFLATCVSIISNGVERYESINGEGGFLDNKRAEFEATESLDTKIIQIALQFALVEDITDKLDSVKNSEDGTITKDIAVNFIVENGGPNISNYTEDQLADLYIEYWTDIYNDIPGDNTESYLQSEINSLKNTSDMNDQEKKTANALITVYEYALQAGRGGLNLSGKNSNIISNLGEYFKQTAWSIDEDEGGWAPTKSNIISAILYTIFIFESIGFFISYLKRLFIVVVLAVLGPFVVIYDFFVKAAMGSQKSIFGVWLKEICTLIFVQTFHAFLLAIILTIIVKIIASSYASTLDGGIKAVGLLCIFALMALPKLELLVKNIFGLTSGVADPSLKGGLKSSISGSLLALGFGKKLLDNPRKILGGAGRFVKSSFAVRNARNNRNEYGILKKGNSGSSSSGNKSGGTKRTITGYRGDVPKLTGGSSAELTRAIKSLTSELRKQNMKSDEKDDKDKLKELNDAIESAKKERVEALKSIGTGVMETVGALHGGVAGAVIAAGTDNNIAEYTLTGAGIGDTVGKTVTNTAYSTAGMAKVAKDGIKAEIRAHTGNTGKAYKQFEKEMKDEMKRSNAELNKKIYEYSKRSVGTKNNNTRVRTKLPDKKNTNIDAGNI